MTLARSLGDELTEQREEVPNLHRAFAEADFAPESRAAAAQLERDLTEQVESAVTRAFRDSFLVGAALALLGLLTMVLPHRRRPA